MNTITPVPSNTDNFVTPVNGEAANTANMALILQPIANRVQYNTNHIATAEATLATAAANALNSVEPGFWAGRFTGSGTTGATHMLSMTQDITGGQGPLRPALADYDGGAQASKLLWLPADSRIEVWFDVLVLHTATTVDYATLSVQSDTVDDFSSPDTRFRSKHFIGGLGGNGVVVRHYMQKTFTTGSSPQYLRFLLQNPSGDSYTLDADCNIIQATWVAKD